jgi:hypothetical protein
MAEQKVPPGITLDVPEEYGDAYTRADGTRETVTRRQRIGRSILKRTDALTKLFTDDKKFKESCKVLADIFTDWTLSGDEGPLPKPWGNPQAFEALIDSDIELTLWVLRLIHTPISELVKPEKN